jgi:hypothetical protein
MLGLAAVCAHFVQSQVPSCLKTTLSAPSVAQLAALRAASMAQQQGRVCSIPTVTGRESLTLVAEPKGSEPPPRSVCQNATLKRSLHAKATHTAVRQERASASAVPGEVNN